jgi:hypothetical protein
MNTTTRRGSVLLVFGLIIAPFASFAQNIASNFGASGQNRERLTLLPGPHLLSPGRGIAVRLVDGAGTTVPALAGERSPTFLPGRIHARPAQVPLSLVPLRQPTVKPMTFDSAVPPAVPLAKPISSPAGGDLRFDAKLPPALPPALRRD